MLWGSSLILPDESFDETIQLNGSKAPSERVGLGPESSILKRGYMAKKEKNYHDPMASMKQHKQMDVSKSVFARGYGNDPAGAFLARPGKDRAQPHVKINECDH